MIKGENPHFNLLKNVSQTGTYCQKSVILSAEFL